MSNWTRVSQSCYDRREDWIEEAAKAITPVLGHTYGPIRQQAIDVLDVLLERGLLREENGDPASS